MRKNDAVRFVTYYIKYLYILNIFCKISKKNKEKQFVEITFKLFFFFFFAYLFSMSENSCCNCISNLVLVYQISNVSDPPVLLSSTDSLVKESYSNSRENQRMSKICTLHILRGTSVIRIIAFCLFKTLINYFY